MRDVFAVLKKTLVSQFYLVNTGFFLLIITLTFGFMSEVEHRALAQYFVASLTTALIPVIIWVIYLFKVLRYNYQALELKENWFLSDLSLLSVRSKILLIALVLFLQLMPAILYCCFLILIAIQSTTYPTLAVFLSAILLLLTAGALLVYRKFHRLLQERKISFIKSFLDRKFTKNIVPITLEWLIRTGFFSLAGSKLFSCVLLYAVSRLYAGETFDARLLALAITVAFAGGLPIVISLHNFDNKDFVWMRNLPLSLSARFSFSFATVLLLNIPEYAVVYRNFPAHLPAFQLLAACFFGVSIHMLFYSILFLIRDQQNITRVMFATLVVWWVLILFKTPVILLCVMNLVASAGIFFRKYYGYQADSS